MEVYPILQIPYQVRIPAQVCQHNDLQLGVVNLNTTSLFAKAGDEQSANDRLVIFRDILTTWVGTGGTGGGGGGHVNVLSNHTIVM